MARVDPNDTVVRLEHARAPRRRMRHHRSGEGFARSHGPLGILGYPPVWVHPASHAPLHTQDVVRKPLKGRWQRHRRNDLARPKTASGASQS